MPAAASTTRPAHPVRRRNHQLVRILTLLRMLETGRYTAWELAWALKVSRRTIFRDLNALDEAHLGWTRVKATGELLRYTRGAVA